jgi:hypothetical protein
MKKLILLGVVMGTAGFLATSALAVPGIFTISATAISQGTNGAGYEVA